MDMDSQCVSYGIRMKVHMIIDMNIYIVIYTYAPENMKHAHDFPNDILK